jgi:phosphoribosylaminoimidazole (AIR) synthetase
MKQISGLDDREMLRTFNCGIGMVLIVKKDCVDEVKALLREAGEGVTYDLGVLTERQGSEEQVEMKSNLA